jgi:hypothetical protein
MAAPQPVRELGQQVINKLTGDANGDGLLKLNGDGHSIAELATLLPELIRITEQTLNVNQLKGQSVGEVLKQLSQRANDADRAKVEQAQQMLTALPILNDLPFEEVYLRATTK